MFVKPYKLKATNTLKNSEKKHLVHRIVEAFPGVKEERAKELVPVKSSASCVKLTLHSGEIVDVFTVDSAPMLIDTEAGLLPTVAALWKVPELVPTIVIHTPVLAKILNGAPLYLPGVEIPHQGVGFPMFPKGTVIAACTVDNQAAAVVGRAAIGSADMLMRAAGVCLETVHAFGDQLCKDPKLTKLERPRLGPVQFSSPDVLADSVKGLSIQPSHSQPSKPVAEEWPALGRPAPAPAPAPPATPVPVPHPPAPVVNEPKVIAAGGQDVGDVLDESVASECMEEDERGIPEDMDGLLRWCLLSFLRLQGKSAELPLLTSLLYRNHMMPMCPPDRTLDVKKSSFKKMGKFMEAMQREGFLTVKEVDKGVDAVVAVHLLHPVVRAHAATAQLRQRLKQAEEAEKEPSEYAPPLVREMLCVTAKVHDFFPALKKGTALTASEVRAELTEYVKLKNLSNAQQKGTVLLDALLAKVLGNAENECVKWDALMSGVTTHMTAATELRWPDGDNKLIKSKLEPITMQVVKRSGNKKVTLVNNLEAYGFQLPALATACQRGVGASCGVTRSPGARTDQLMLQGDQTHFVAKLLVEKYGLPKKFVDGADKALNKKK
ncbi:hypothetical protein O0L34_g9128 [Tuta absoluta]|nr:hypothetical protein O0L34_g9128 [Tuta absoluta]